MVNSVKNYNEQPLSTEAEWESTIIDNSPYVRDLLNKIEEVVSCSVDPIGLTIALTGALGSGKSSIVKQTLRNLKEEYSYLELSENNSEENSGNDSVQKLVDAEVAGSSSHNEGSPAARKIELKVSEFRCLWFQNDEALLLGFIEHLSGQISSIEQEAGKKFLKIALPKLISGGLRISQLASYFVGIPLSESLVDAIVKAVENMADSQKEPHENSDSMDELLLSLQEALEQKDAKESKKRILIVLDDLDRLDSNEVLAMFRLIKTFGNLPNIMFLLVYDNDIISAIVDKHFPESKGKYLDKFIQLRVNMLPARRYSIANQLKRSILKACAVSDDSYMADRLNYNSYFCSVQHLNYFKAKGKDGGLDSKQESNKFTINFLITSNLRNARDVNLVKNAVSTSWGFCKHQIILSDIVAIEIIKQYQSDLFNKIYDYADMYEVYGGILPEYLEDSILTPFICDFGHQISPVSQSLSSHSLLKLYFFGVEHIESSVKSQLPDFYMKLKEVNNELTADKFKELLYALIKNITTPAQYLFDTHELHLRQKLDYVVIYFMTSKVESSVATLFINQLFQEASSKHFNDLVVEAINSKNVKNKRCYDAADTIACWLVSLIIDNEVYKTNQFFDNSILLEKLASIKEKNIYLFLHLASSYSNINSIDWLDNARSCYSIFINLLQEQIDNDALLNSYNGFSVLIDACRVISYILNKANKHPHYYSNPTDELFYKLKQIFSEIKEKLTQKLNNNQFGDLFVLDLINRLNTYLKDILYDKRNVHYKNFDKQDIEEVIPVVGQFFKEEFIEFYDINIYQVFELVSEYVDKLNIHPQVSNPMKENAQNALKIIRHAMH